MKNASILLVGIILLLMGCSKHDIDELRARQDSLDERVSKLETWQKTVNNNINSLQTIVASLADKEHVTDVTRLADGSGYVIHFEHNDDIIIKNGENGKDGVTPVIGVKQDKDGIYYWTLNGEWLTDIKGGKLRVTGEKGDKGNTGASGPSGSPGRSAVAPKVRVNADTNMWEISTDGGTNWTSTGVNATGDQGDQGDAIFKADGIDLTNMYYVELTLADDSKIQLPRHLSFKIGKDKSNGTIIVTAPETTYDLLLPTGMKEEDYVAIVAQVYSEHTGTNIQTRAATTSWTAEVTKPTTGADGVCNNDATVKLKAPGDASDGESVLLEVSLIRNDGGKTVAARVIKYETAKNGSFYYSDGTYSSTLDPEKECIGIIAATGDVAADDAKLKEVLGETSTGNHGLVVALKGMSVYRWQFKNKSVYDWANSNMSFTNVVVASTSSEDIAKLNKAVGYTNTLVCKEYNKDISNNGQSMVLVVSTLDGNYTSIPKNSSGWFVPSAKELSTICSGVNSITLSSSYGVSNRDLINAQLQKLNDITPGTANLFKDSDIYHTSTEANYSTVETVDFSDGYLFSYSKQVSSYILRPVLAF